VSGNRVILGRSLFLYVSEHKSRHCRIHIYIAARVKRFRKWLIGS